MKSKSSNAGSIQWFNEQVDSAVDAVLTVLEDNRHDLEGVPYELVQAIHNAALSKVQKFVCNASEIVCPYDAMDFSTDPPQEKKRTTRKKTPRKKSAAPAQKATETTRNEDKDQLHIPGLTMSQDL